MANIIRLDNGYEFDLNRAIKIESEWYETEEGWIICVATEWPYAEEELYRTEDNRWVIHRVNTFLTEHEHMWFEISETKALLWIRKYAAIYDTIAL